MITITAYPEEVILLLNQLPKKIQTALRAKYAQIFNTLTEDLFANVPGKFLDPSMVQSGVQDLGSAVVGFIEIQDKPGVYTILPNKAKLLRFLTKDGERVWARQVLRHPYIKGAPIAERLIQEKLAWIESELEDAMIEAL